MSAAAWSQTPFVGTCAEDDQINAATRESIDSAAQKFVHFLIGSEAGAAYEMLSTDGKEGLTRDQLAAQILANRQLLEVGNLRTQHTYVLKIIGKSPGTVVCGTNSPKPSGWASMAAADITEQAHTLLMADARNNRLVFTVWLVPEGGAWRIQSFWMNVATLAAMDSEQLLELGRAEKQKGHTFNAALLYAAAGQTANRGPNFRMDSSEAIAEEMDQLTVPPEVTGQPPYIWSASGATFKVLNVGPIAVAGKVYVMIQHEAPAWKDDSQAEALNRSLIAYFKNRFAEYSAVFAGVVARVHERGGSRGYGTVDELSSSGK